MNIIIERAKNAYGFFDPNRNVIGISFNEGVETEIQTMFTLNHEYLHAILHKVEGLNACCKMDNLMAKTTCEGFY